MSNQQNLNCFICNTKVIAYRHATTSRTEFDCNHCGRYYLSDCLLNDAAWIRPIMFFCLLHNSSGKRVFFVSNLPDDKDEYEDAHFVTKSIMESRNPKTINDKIDMIMLNLGKKITFVGDYYTFAEYRFSGDRTELINIGALILVCNTFTANYNDKSSFNEIRGTLKLLEDYGYLERISDNYYTYTFTINGWKHLGELQSKESDLPQAFIAMWFSSEMDDARNSIKRAVNDSGYIPIIIDEKEHNNQIVPEILYEIQRSKFLIADLSGHRNGVYYEAGYAQGLGKEVIFTCSEKAFKERHFDVAQVSTVVWSNENDLYKRLSKRIEATVGKRK